ncbi:hypothetical protein JCM10207_008910 [Rhodosporidiobolus poonsookiae]
MRGKHLCEYPRAATRFAESRQPADSASESWPSQYQDKLNSSETDHIPEDKKMTAIETVANAESWIANKLASQAEKMPNEKLSVTSADILKRRDEVFNTVAPIVTLPKPKPKTEEPKKEDADMADAEKKDEKGRRQGGR